LNIIQRLANLRDINAELHTRVRALAEHFETRDDEDSERRTPAHTKKYG
jgi:hypothetical protein